MAYSQDNRLIAVETPLGKDVLLLEAVAGREGMSRLFRFDLDLLSENSSLSFDDIIGQRVAVRVELADETFRYFNGFVSRFAQGRSDQRFTRYRAEVVPWLWFLTRTADCRIFQNKTVPQIVSQIFEDLGFTDYQMKVHGSYQPRDYCVQYRETDFNFVSRLMEEEGIYYFFEHEETKHTLIISDAPDENPACPKQTSARYEEMTGAMGEEDVVTAWELEQELRPGKYHLTDYCFETPTTNLAVNVQTNVVVGGNTAFEVYDFPGEYAKVPDGDRLVKLRMQEEEASHKLVNGASNCRSFTTGYRFDLKEHYRRDVNKPYLLIDIHHVATTGGAYYGSGEGAAESYSNSFTCIPYTVPFRPRRITPTPVVQGSQTAVVVGPPGEEIYTDKYARVKVQFHWDREGKRDENSSCWIRVSSPWAGKGYGGVSIPRIGQEVIVDFIEGNPDLPIITGRVYNAEQTPPYSLPANKTQGGLISRSSKGGSGDNANEIRMEDAAGNEELFIHGEKDLVIEAENLVSSAVGYPNPYPFPKPGAGCRKTTIKQDEILIVKDGNREATVEKGNDTVTISLGKQTNTVKQEIVITSQSSSIHVTAATEIQLLVGASKLLMKSDGSIELSGKNIGINGSSTVEVHGDQVTSKGDTNHNTEGGIVLSKASGTNTVTGGTVLLNP